MGRGRGDDGGAGRGGGSVEWQKGGVGGGERFLPSTTHTLHLDYSRHALDIVRLKSVLVVLDALPFVPLAHSHDIRLRCSALCRTEDGPKGSEGVDAVWTPGRRARRKVDYVVQALGVSRWRGSVNERHRYCSSDAVKPE